MPEPQATRSARSQGRLIVWAIFLFALLVRVTVIIGTIKFHTPAVLEPAADSRIFITLVQNLLGGRGFSFNGPTAITAPLYVFFLAGLYRLFGDPAVVRLVQAMLGAWGCVLLYAIGRKAFDPRTGLIAAGLLSIYPFAAYLAGLHLEENLFLVLLLLMLLQSLRLVDRPTPLAAIGLGGLIGLAALTRAVFIAFPPLMLIWAVNIWGIRNPVAYRTFALAMLGTGLVILPWTLRNYVVLGAIVPVQNNVGMAFWAGNNAHSAGGWVWPTHDTWTDGSPPDDDKYGWRNLSTAEENRRYVQTALSWIREHPHDYIRLLPRKLGRLYGFTRAEDKQDLKVPLSVFVFHATFLVAALLGLLVRLPQWRTLSLFLVLIVFTNLITLLFTGATRYTMPMVPSLILLAASALEAGWSYAARVREVRLSGALSG